MTLPAISLRPESFSIFRLAAAAAIPEQLADTPMTFISRTSEELSIVCSDSLAAASGLAASAPDDGSSTGWSCFKVEGPIDFSVVGLLAQLSAALAAAEVSLFALSTFDTDYVLVRTEALAKAQRALLDAGFPLS